MEVWGSSSGITGVPVVCDQIAFCDTLVPLEIPACVAAEVGIVEVHTVVREIARRRFHPGRRFLSVTVPLATATTF